MSSEEVQELRAIFKLLETNSKIEIKQINTLIKQIETAGVQKPDEKEQNTKP
jgi:hypothetical protein